MASNVDVQKVFSSLGESGVVNLDMSLRELVGSPAIGLVNSVADLEPWDLICYTWVTLIRRAAIDEQVIIPVERLRHLAQGSQVGQGG